MKMPLGSEVGLSLGDSVFWVFANELARSVTSGQHVGMSNSRFVHISFANLFYFDRYAKRNTMSQATRNANSSKVVGAI